MRISTIIRRDREYKAFRDCLAETYLRSEPLPIVINGLSGGAVSAYLACAVREAVSVSGKPVLVMTGDESERASLCASLLAEGIGALEYKPRDLVFYNISASHDVDRERLEVLSALINGTCEAVVTTPAAALAYTMPRDTLESLSLCLRLGDELSPMLLSERLSADA